MAFVPKCDNCDEIYKPGFLGSYKKVISKGSKTSGKDFVIDIVIRPPHLCDKCFKLMIRKLLQE